LTRPKYRRFVSQISAGRWFITTGLFYSLPLGNREEESAKAFSGNTKMVVVFKFLQFYISFEDPLAWEIKTTGIEIGPNGAKKSSPRKGKLKRKAVS